jgi:PmbA protein
MDTLLSDAVDRLLSRAKALGADGADAAVSDRQSLSVSVRLGKLEGVEREESRSAGLRVLIGQRQAGASTSDFSPAALDALAERVVAMARLAPEDPWTGLPVPGETASEIADLALHDPSEPTLDRLESRAVVCERAALDIEGVTNSAGASADWGAGRALYGATNGFRGAWQSSSWHVGTAVLAERGDHKERDYESRGARRERDLPDAASIGREAGERAVLRLGSRKRESCIAPVIFENRVASRFLAMLAGAISGAAVARGVSFLRDAMGQQVFAPGIEIIDDPLVPGGWGSRPFDGEGLAGRARTVIEDGLLTTWLLNRAAAAQLGLVSTGHASLNPGGPPGVSASNLTLTPGDLSLDMLMSEAGEGLLVQETLSPSFNPNTGDYSVGVSGQWFELGRPVHPVSEMTVAGNMADIFARLVPGGDLENRSSMNSPSVLIDALTVAGV